MVSLKAVLIVALALGTLCSAQDKGSCPSSPPTNATLPKKAAPPRSSDPDKKYLGTVTLMVVLSDTGYVCNAHVLRGISKEIDMKAETTARGWHFEPARKNGHAVPVTIAVDANYWTNGAGEIVSDPPRSSAPSEKVGNTPIR